MTDKREITRNRRSIRLKGYDYSSNGAYFLTMCVHKFECLLGDIQNGQMILNQYGEIVRDIWEDLPNRVSDIDLDEYVIMPNHFHAILVIEKSWDSADVVEVIHELPLFDDVVMGQITNKKQ